ncbi:MAG: VOC family protein [Geminicoccaceae bacterium]
MQVHPYLSFEGRCEEAIAYYRGAVDAEVVMLMRFRDAPDPSMVAPGTADKVMHATLKIGDSQVMCTDGRCQGHGSFQGTSLALTVADPAEAERRFAALAEGGQVQMPLAATFFASRFGMVRDRFGVPWMIVTAS